MQKVPEKEHPRKSEVQKVKPLETKVAYPELRKKVETKNEVEEPRLKELPPLKVKMQSLEPLETEKTIMKWKSPKTKKIVPKAREEEEEYELGKPPEVKNSSTTRESMVDKQKPEIDIPKSITSRTPSEEKEIEASQPNVLPDHNLGEKEYFKTLTEDRGHYLLQKEKRLETNKVAEEEKLSQKDEDETSSCKRERKKIAEFKDKKPKIKRKGSEKINQMKGVAEEMKEAVADKETDKSQEILLPQTAEIQGKEKISEVRGVEQEKRRKIPFHADEELEAVISNREVESPKPTAAQPKQSSIEFSSDQTNDEVDELQRKELPSPSIKKLSKGPSKTSRSGVKEDAPTIENFPQLQEGKESTSSVEGTRASEDVANELDNPLAEKLVVAKEESTRRRPDQEVEKTHSSQQEEDHEGHAIEEEKAGEGENVVQLEISRESEDLEDIEVEASGKRVELRAPLVVAGSVFIVSLIIFFFGHKRSGKR
ncbi:uncharacterized protein LOC129292474 [Prosopis cineraria]|uniref:uncharacterized protein LOC129292474 n=1 Tax=Prosopis cineraria TaxID=364024 RepID=UPI00240FC70C|nr:uncharacterized protein LOC129292474 [Prosopis cineraria]